MRNTSRLRFASLIVGAWLTASGCAATSPPSDVVAASLQATAAVDDVATKCRCSVPVPKPVSGGRSNLFEGYKTAAEAEAYLVTHFGCLEENRWKIQFTYYEFMNLPIYHVSAELYRYYPGKGEAGNQFIPDAANWQHVGRLAGYNFGSGFYTKGSDDPVRDVGRVRNSWPKQPPEISADQLRLAISASYAGGEYGTNWTCQQIASRVANVLGYDSDLIFARSVSGHETDDSLNRASNPLGFDAKLIWQPYGVQGNFQWYDVVNSAGVDSGAIRTLARYVGHYNKATNIFIGRANSPGGLPGPFPTSSGQFEPLIICGELKPVADSGSAVVGQTQVFNVLENDGLDRYDATPRITTLAGATQLAALVPAEVQVATGPSDTPVPVLAPDSALLISCQAAGNYDIQYTVCLPPEAAYPEYSEAGGDSSLVLAASRSYQPSNVSADTRTLEESTSFVVPRTLPVATGKPGSGLASLEWTDGASTIGGCVYRGQGGAYALLGCTGSGAGKTVSATAINLTVLSGDSKAGETRVILDLSSQAAASVSGPSGDNGEPGLQSCASQTLTVSCCQPKSCADLGFQCGAGDDGCGGTLDCGGCTAPSVCGTGHLCQDCPAGQTLCNGACIDTATDNNNCGGCGRVCVIAVPEDDSCVCQAGACVLVDPDGDSDPGDDTCVIR